MTSEEIERLISNGEKSIALEKLVPPLLGWVLSLGATLFGVISLQGLGFFFAIPLALVSLFASFDNFLRWRNIKSRLAESIWRHLEKTFFAPYINGVTTELTRDIASLYQADPRGEVLTLSQAVRLVETHHKQQQRLDIVIARLASLQSIGAALRDKTKQLRALGESHEQGETRLQTLRDDEAALDAMRLQIQASCHRLEMILIETRKAQQMRQLHREINALTAQRPASDAFPSHLTPDDALSDIERQITREVETFLRLERETDRHMREI